MVLQRKENVLKTSHSTKRLFLSFLHYPQLGSQTLEQVSDLGLNLCCMLSSSKGKGGNRDAQPSNVKYYHLSPHSCVMAQKCF